MILKTISTVSLLSYLTLLNASNTTQKYKVISGVYTEKLASPLFYDTFVPIWFRFRFPRWEEMDMKLNVTKCSSPEWVKGSSCPTTFYLPEVQRRFINYVLDSQPAKLKDTFTWASQPEKLDSSWNNPTTSSKPNLWRISETTLNHYMSTTQNKSAIPNKQFAKTIINFNYNVLDVYRSMASGFRNEVWAKLPADRIDAGLWSNAVNSLTALAYGNFQMEVNRWKFAMQECSMGRLPSILNRDQFHDLGYEVQEALEETLFKPTIPFGCGISCYSTGLSTCVFTDTEFVLRLLVPVVSKVSRNLELVEAKSAKFMLNDTHVCQHEFPRDLRFIKDNDNQLAYSTNCIPGQLCSRREALKPNNIDLCLSATLNEDLSLTELAESCPLRCRRIPSFYEDTIVERIGPQQFLICGKENGADADVTVKGPGGVEEYLRPIKTGALLVSIPCGFTIYSPYFRDPKGIPVSCPTDDDDIDGIHVTSVIPPHWLREEVINGTNAFSSSEFSSEDLRFHKEESDAEESFDEDSQISKMTEGDSTNPTIYAMFVVCALLPTLLVVVVGWKLHNLSQRIKDMEQERQSFACQDFNNLAVIPLVSKSQSEEPENENLYQDVQYLEVF